MNEIIDKHYIDLTPDKCISIDSRHILLRHRSDNSYYQGRPINTIEGILVDEIVRLRSGLSLSRAERDVMAEAVKHATYNTEMITKLMQERDALRAQAASRAARRNGERGRLDRWCIIPNRKLSSFVRLLNKSNRTV